MYVVSCVLFWYFWEGSCRLWIGAYNVSGYDVAVVVQRQTLPSYTDGQTLGQIRAESGLVQCGWHGVAVEDI